MIFFLLQPWVLFNLLFGYEDSLVECPRNLRWSPKNCGCEVHDRYNPVPKLAINCVDYNKDDPGGLRNQIHFYKDYNISELWITNSTFPHLPHNALSVFKSLNRVALHNVTLNSISKDERSVFAGLETTLKWFYLDDVSFMESFDWSQFRDVRSLNIIHIFHSYLETSDNVQALGNIPIKEFYVWGSTGLDFVGETSTFNRNSELVEFGLRRVGLKAITRDLFPRPAPKLTSIEICQNPIKYLPADLFHDMPVLQNLDLSENQILSFDPELFRPILTGIKSLRLGQHLFFCKDGDVWFLKEPNDQNPFRYEGLQCYYPIPD